MAKNGKKEVNPLDALTSLVDTTNITKKTSTKKKAELVMPLDKELGKLVEKVIDLDLEIKKLKTDYEVGISEVREKSSAFLNEVSFKSGKCEGSFFVQAESRDNRMQIIPKDKFSIVDPDNIDDIKKLLGNDIFNKFIEQKTNISVKAEVVEDKEKLAKLVNFIKANPEVADMIKVEKTFVVADGGLDMTYQIPEKKRETLLTLVKLDNNMIKIVAKPK